MMKQWIWDTKKKDGLYFVYRNGHAIWSADTEMEAQKFIHKKEKERVANQKNKERKGEWARRPENRAKQKSPEARTRRRLSTHRPPRRKNQIQQYQAPIKAEYRAAIWKALCPDKPLGKALFFSGPTGPEIPLLRSLGFADRDMILVDEDPNCITTAIELNKCKSAESFADGLSYIVRKLPSGIAHANLDYCGNIDGDLPIETMDFLNAGVLIDGARIAITFLAAREQRKFEFVKLALKSLGAESRYDILTVILEQNVRYGIKEVARGSYQNGNSPMGWIVYEVVRKPGVDGCPRELTRPSPKPDSLLTVTRRRSVEWNR